MNPDFDNTYERELEGFFVPWHGDPAPAPRVISLNRSLAAELGMDFTSRGQEEIAAIFSGSQMLDGSSPIAQVYAGHQFGGFSPQLGDGRALLLGEIIDTGGRRRDIQLKGSGRTPFSRSGDGKAAIGPVLREYIVSEAMHALGIPTTRALAAISTGGQVMRETALPGAVLTRVAASHIRVGTFEYFAARGETDRVRQLADYAIARHYPSLAGHRDRYLQLLRAVSDAQALLVAQWMLVGFVHGVMNTDNTTISGETIDYGPCAFMDTYDTASVFSSIDVQGRYQYQNQPAIAVWNLSRLAETLVTLIDSQQEVAVEKATAVLNEFSETYQSFWLDGMRDKLGLSEKRDGDAELATCLLELMEQQRVDYTRFFRSLAKAAAGAVDETNQLADQPEAFKSWISRWQQRLGDESLSPAQRTTRMNLVNPVYIPRNHKVEEALDAATNSNDFGRFRLLLDVVTAPFDERPEYGEYALAAPQDFGPYRTFCGT